MKKITPFLFISFFIAQGSFSQVQWPTITQTSKPWTRWWWQGNAVNKKDLGIVMQQYKQAGLGGLELTPIYGVAGHEKEFISYLSPKWMDVFTYTLQRAKQLGIGLDMSCGTGWPFGGGPLVTPDVACRDLEFKVYHVKGGERFDTVIQFIQQPYLHITGNQVYKLDQVYKGNDEETKNMVAMLQASAKTLDINQLKYPIYANSNLQAISFDQVKYPRPLPLQILMAYSDNNTGIDLTNKVSADGKLNWTPGPGNWTLYALFLGWHGKIVERAAPGAEGDVIDHFSSVALKKYLSRFDTAFAGRNVSGLRAFFNDSYEVDDARGQSNWTADFFKEFSRLRGYALQGFLPELLARDSSERHLRILCDYRQTISDLLLEKFTIGWHDWAHSKGSIIRNQAHGSPANILDLYAASDIPETEGTDILRYKFASSAAHVTGKPLASAETVTWLGEHFLSSLGDVKQAIDKYFAGGINHVFYHGMAYSPAEEAWPGWLFYASVHFTPASPAWEDFGTLNNYIAHVQSFLQKGKPDNDVLVYYPFYDRNSEPGNAMLNHFDGIEGFNNTGFKGMAEYLQNNGYSFDFISDRQLMKLSSGGSLLQTGGVKYKAIILPDVRYFPAESMGKLMQLVQAGATVLVYKNFPSKVPGYSHYQEKETELNKISSFFQFTRIGNIQKVTAGKGKVLWGDDMAQLLSDGSIRQEQLVQSGLIFCRRQYENGSYYFIANKSNTPINDFVTLQTGATTVVIFDPMSQKAGLAKFSKLGDTATKVFLQLLPGESCIVQLSRSALTGNKYPYYKVSGAAQPVSGNWTINFLKGGPTLPAKTTVDHLGSWTDLPAAGVKEFSGSAAYTIHFAKPTATGAQAWILDLGKVSESAEVKLNGKKLATLIDTIAQVIIPATGLQQDNVLEITVSNSMANRITDMDKKGIQWKKFYNTDFPARFPADRGPDGLFTATKWEPRPSGLLGPVTLTPVVFIR